MTNTLRQVGHREDSYHDFTGAARHGNELVVFYTADVRSYDDTPCGYSLTSGVSSEFLHLYPERPFARNVPRWGVVDLNPPWPARLEQLGTVAASPGRPQLLSIRHGPRPDITSGGYDILPVSPVNWYLNPGSDLPFVKGTSEKGALEERMSQIRECTRTSPYCIARPFPFGPSGELIVVARDPDTSDISFKIIRVADDRYFTRWAIPVHIALFPLALAVDLATLPFQLPFLFCM
jgi:hypothetical protein